MCVSEHLLCGSSAVHNQITSSPSFICRKLLGSYLLHEPLRRLLYRLHPLRQTKSYPQQPHTRYPHCFWNKHKLTTPTNGSSCYQNSFICYSTLQKLSNARTPLNKLVRCYHTLWAVFFSTAFIFCQAMLHILNPKVVVKGNVRSSFVGIYIANQLE